MILLIDNYDSFSYNLYQYIGEIAEKKLKITGTPKQENPGTGAPEQMSEEMISQKLYPGDQTAPLIKVIRNDELTVDQIRDLKPQRIILSPGPGRPEDAGVIMEVASRLGKNIPVLGVCLGHQAICAAFGATVTYAKRLMHGKQSNVRFDKSCLLFKDCPDIAPVARYHSLAAAADTMPEALKVTALTDEEEIMAVQHREYPIYGVQFHPESILTPDGKKMLENFILG